VPKKKQKSEKSSQTEKQLKSALKKARAQLGVAERSAEKWKSRSKAHQSAAAGAKTELSDVRRRLEKAEASATKGKDRAGRPAPEVVPVATSTTVDDSWNVTRLRAEARGRGVAGYSRKTKAQLLADLRG
jgi:hypothetical protein